MGARTQSSTFRRSHSLALAIEKDVRQGRLRSGDRLPSEQGLCERFGVSRTVVREALQSLKGRGVVVSRRGSGNYVGDVAGGGHLRDSLDLYSAVSSNDARAFLELLDLRLLVECECAARAARGRTGTALRAIEQQLEAMTAARRDLARFGEADIAFHRAVVAASGHELFAHILGALLEQVGVRFARQTYTNFKLVEKNLRDHRAVYRAISDSDAEAAEQAMRRHLAESRENLIGFLAEQKQGV